MNDKQQRSIPTSRPLWRSVLAALPTLLVLTSIAAVGYWGHHTGWKAPKLAHLLGSDSSAENEDWCIEHNVPDSRCIACHPELAGESSADWCKEHGVPESKCTVCHPEILTTGVAGDWCKEHGLPESGCTICHPEIARKGELPAEEDDVVVSNGSPLVGSTSAATSAAGRDPSTCQKHALKVQFASVAAMQKCGVRLGQVIERKMSDSVSVNAQADYDRTRFAAVASRVPGTAWSVERELGDAVAAGDVLALIESAEIGRAKADLLQAQTSVEVTARSLDRARASSEAGFRPEAERLEAEGLAREAHLRLFNTRQALGNLGLIVPTEDVSETTVVTLGLPESALAALHGSVTSANLMALTAPFAGVVVGREIVRGDVIETSRTLFEVADTSTMWVTMHVPTSEAQRVALGADFVFQLDAARDEPVLGSIAWISTSIDEMTRTVEMRASVANPDGALRAHSFGRARIVVRQSTTVIAVPTAAIQWEGCCYVVFVRISDDIFQTRKVRLGVKDAAYTEILAGVLPGEVVATTGSHVLKSEILKSNLGAGCCAAE